MHFMLCRIVFCVPVTKLTNLAVIFTVHCVIDWVMSATKSERSSTTLLTDAIWRMIQHTDHNVVFQKIITKQLEKRPSIDVGPTTLARSMTLTLAYDLDLQSPASYRHGLYSHAKVQGQRSVGSEGRMEISRRTDRRTDGGDPITSLANAVGNKTCRDTLVDF